MEFNKVLQMIRKEHKLSQEEVAEKLGVSRQAVAKWESGIAYPDLDNLICLSELFCVTIDYLVKKDRDCSNQNPKRDSIEQEELAKFLVEAKQNTYAGKAPEEEKSMRLGSHDYLYSKGNFLYIDSYVGGESFAGEEVVYYENNPIWAMNYTGRTLSDLFSGDFLREALLHVTEATPFRGPNIYRKDRYVYHNKVSGELSWFHGKEEIYCEDILVFECIYHGGKIR